MTTKYEEKINCLEVKVNQMDKSNAVFEEIVKNLNGSIDKLFLMLDNLNSTLSGIEHNMIGMQNEIKVNADGFSDLKIKVKELDDNTKFNFVSFLGSKVIPFLLGAGVLYLILTAR